LKCSAGLETEKQAQFCCWLSR